MSHVVGEPFFLHIITKTQISCVVTMQLIGPFVFAPLLPGSEIWASGRLLPSAVGQPGLRRTWSDAPRRGSLASLLK